MNELERFLETKGAEYAPFDTKRAPRILQKLGLKFSAKQKIVQIIGTNGKGSTGRFLALMLKTLGVNVGHFTSPHLFKVTERFWINGANLSDSNLNRAFLELDCELLKEASYFEVLTFLAFIVFRECEVVVLEAGLGGIYDSTSTCVKADLTLFTSIGMDHQDYLGHSLEEIATTKLKAMAKQAILGLQNDASSSVKILRIAREIAREKGADLEVLDAIPCNLETYARQYYPSFQVKNFTLAFSGLLCLNKMYSLQLPFLLNGHFCESALKEFLESLPPLDLLGRMQQIASNIIVDVAHNVDSATVLLECLKSANFSQNKYVLIYNSYSDKNPKAILSVLKPIIARVEIFSVCAPRVIKKTMLEEILCQLNLPYCDFKKLEKTQQYLVCGSFSVVSKFLRDFRDSKVG